MEALIKEQKNLAGEMSSSFLSYTKNPSRKTIPAIKSRLAKHNELWTYFKKNNDTLIANLNPDHGYLIDNVFQNTKDSHEKTIEKLEQDLAELVALETSGTTSAEDTSTTFVSNLGQPSNYAPVTIPTPWSNISIWSSTTVESPMNPVSTATVGSPWSSTATTLPTDPWPPTTVTLPTYTTSTFSANSPSNTTLGGSASNQNAATNNLNNGNINSTNTTMANLNGTVWTTQPNPQYVMTPNQQFMVPNQQFAIPNQQFMSPNQQHTIQNLQNGNTTGLMNYAHPYNLPKLQPLTISKFDGCIKKWSAFSDLFRTIIHNNPCLQNIQKMQYLIGYLEGEPARIIQHLNLSDSNYVTAINLLRDRYDNPRKMLDNYISTILDLKKVEFRSAKDVIILADTMKECLAAISNLNYNISHWDPIIVTIAMRKLDHESIRLFEESLANQKIMPSLSELYRFLDRRYQVLETTKKDVKNAKENHKQILMTTTTTASTSNKKDAPTCKMCNQGHKIQHCEKFKQLATKERSELVNKLKICANCLQHDKSTKCKSKHSCQHCGKKNHHSLLHFGNQNKGGNENKASPAPTENTVANFASIVEPATINMISNSRHEFILLATALVRVKTIFNEWEWMRIVVDLGSQGTFITESAVQKLGLPRERFITPLKALGDISAGKSMTKVDFELQPRFQSNFRLRVNNAIIMKKIVQDLPGRDIAKLTAKRYGNLLLADPNYDVNGPVDILLNAEVYGDILKKGLLKGKPTAQNTELGWILFGALPEVQLPAATTLNIISMISMAEIDNNMRKFWQIENSSSQTTDEICEQHYQKTHTRDKDGRYIVRLPFKENKMQIGSTKSMAVVRFYNMERKMSKNDSNFGTKYHQFLQEYHELGHMKEVEDEEMTNDIYYLPHHAATPLTKFRVVFDGSCKPKNGISLNDALHVGPKLQQSLVEILNRWRIYKYVLTADIEKMFRQIKVHEEDQPYQRILYRSKPDVPLQTFQLSTVTYGTACATFLSVRTLLQLAEDDGEQYPMAKTILKRDFYVDDMMTGSHKFKDALQSQEQIKMLTKQGGFNLRKWASNDKRLLSNIPLNSQAIGTHEINDEDSIKTLGIRWSPAKDEFGFKIRSEILTKSQLTKREFLSIISSIYDPIGWLSPFTVKTKIMMQKIWEPETGWDEKIPPPIQKDWNKICDEVSLIEKIFIPRWIHYQPDVTTQIHAFCDASADAYSAVLYSRIVLDNEVKITLLTAKTRVTPLKMDKNSNTTIPRLELCGALLLAELLHETLEKANMENLTLFAWSDSTTALNWINKNPSNDRFISNRTNRIRGLTKPEIWRYVPGEQNPADCASRGIYPKQLLEHKLWWNGPDWLSLSEEHWPKLNIEEPGTVIIPEKISLAAVVKARRWLTVTKKGKSWNLLAAYSDLSKLVRVLAYCQRFCNNASKKSLNFGFLTTSELEAAELVICRQTQKEGFSTEIRDLELKRPLQRTSKLLSLNPFMDGRGLMRVGGRLKNSDLAFSQKYPIILPKGHHITVMVIRQAHNKTLHGGRQLTAAYLNRQFWIINSTTTIKTVIDKCIRCLKLKGKITEQLMGNLPRDRVVPSAPFSHSGVDFTGEFHVRMSKGRGTKTYKSYVCLFVCMATKAIHLELVSDMTTEAFLAAYKRFTGRRGHCKEIFSDNGGNFVSANKKLNDELKAAIKEATKSAAETTAQDGTIWYFNPPRAAYFGGLFEAGIKSIKGHLKRVLGDTTLTFEEFTTVLTQVEACVNSRPITPLTNDPNDLEALTPGHFLIGRPLINPPEADLTQMKSCSNRWKLLTKLKQEIWARWSAEYLTTLQQRPKWREGKENLKIGDLVLIKEDFIAPTKWPLGRIQEVIKGNDEKVRVVHVLCKKGLDSNNQIVHQILPRAINRICPLPSDEKDDQQSPPSGEMEEQNFIAPSEVSEIKVNLMATTKKNAKRRTYDEKLEVILDSKKPIKRDNEHIQELVRRFKAAPQTTKKRKVTISPVFWCIITLLFGLAFGSDNFENKGLEHGLYIESTGYCQLLKGSVRLESSINYSDLIQDEDDIKQVLNDTTNLCAITSRVKSETQCETLVRHLKQQTQNLLQDVGKIKSIISPRQKRGLLGRFLQGVFGVNEEVYIDLNALNTNQQILRNVMNQQNLQVGLKINQTYEKVNQKLTNFNEKLNEVIGKINEMDKWYIAIDINAISIRLLSTYMAATNYISEIQEKYTKLTKILLDHGSFIDIVDMTTLHQTIEFTNAKLPSNMILSMIPQRQVQQSKNNGTLKIYGFMDIIDVSKYEVLHITPVPKAIGNKTFVIPMIPFITVAVNYNDQTYFILSDEELNRCTTTNDELLLCNPSIISNMESNPNCVIDEIYNRHPKHNCSLVKFTLENILWKQLTKQNTWLYVAVKKTSVAIVCQGERNDIIIQDVGIIKINNDCTIKTDRNSLRFHTTFNQMVHSTFTKPTNFSIERYDKLDESTKIRDIEPIIPSKTTLSTYLQPNTDQLLKIGKHDDVNTTTYAACSIIAVIIVVLIIINKVRNQINKMIICGTEYQETAV